MIQIETQVESDYIDHVREECGRERHQQNILRHHAKYSYSQYMREEYKYKLENLQTPYCNKLDEIVSVIS